MSDPAAQIRVYASMQEAEQNIKEDGGRETEMCCKRFGKGQEERKDLNSENTCLFDPMSENFVLDYYLEKITIP